MVKIWKLHLVSIESVGYMLKDKCEIVYSLFSNFIRVSKVIPKILLFQWNSKKKLYWGDYSYGLQCHLTDNQKIEIEKWVETCFLLRSSKVVLAVLKNYLQRDFIKSLKMVFWVCNALIGCKQHASCGGILLFTHCLMKETSIELNFVQPIV